MSYQVTFKKVVNNLIFSESVFCEEGYYCLDFKGSFFVNNSLVYFPWIYFYEFKKNVCGLLYFANVAFHITNLKLFKNTLWSLFKDGVQLPQGYRAATRRHFYFFTIKFPEIPGTHSGSCVKDRKYLV